MRLKRLLMPLKWILAMIIMGGCSANWHLKKAKFKNPDLFVNDTIRDTVTVVYDPPVVSDTVIIYDMDTVVIQDSIVDLRFIRHKDTLWYEVDCKPDTVKLFREVEVPVIREVNKEVNANPWLFVGGVLSTIIIFVIGFNISRR